jgi:DNA-binding NarL/FixJ family response regulator
MIRVLLVDDHPVVRSGYRRLLETADDVLVVGEASDAETAYALLTGVQPLVPDVIVTDLSMAGASGLDLIRHVLQRHPLARILVFSMHDGEMLVRRALAAGAMGFLTKASAPDDLVIAVRALHEGRRYLGPDLPAALLSASSVPNTSEARALKSLSSREFEIFRLLAQGSSCAQCAQTLQLSPKTVANHQTVIKEKLGVDNSAALAHLALRHQVIGWPTSWA